MDSPTLISRTIPFPILGVSGGIFHLYQILIDRTVSKLGDPLQIPHKVVSDLGLHCLPMSPKKDARLVWHKVEAIPLLYTQSRDADGYLGQDWVSSPLDSCARMFNCLNSHNAICEKIAWP